MRTICSTFDTYHRISVFSCFFFATDINDIQIIIAIASIASDKVEYPQKQAKEVYRKFPEDNILERIFVSNSDNVNEYVVASIGLTRADVEDFNIKLSLTGFGYKIVRVNVVPKVAKEENDEQNK